MTDDFSDLILINLRIILGSYFREIRLNVGWIE